MEELGKYLVGIGFAIVIVGIVVILSGKIPLLGKLPGDISIQTSSVSCFIPIASSILLSLLLTVILNIILRIMNK